MTANSNRFSTASLGSGSDGKAGEQKKDLWLSLLDSVASGKRLPEKNVVVLGGTPDTQRDFLETLSSNESRRLDRNNSKPPPIANNFALGYTYHDVLDADQEDILARISLYLLSDPNPAFASLLKPLFTPQSIPNTLVVILVDWSRPWQWMRQLRKWIMLLKSVIMSLSIECKEVMEELMISWKDRGRGGGSTNLDGTGAVAAEGDVALPIGPGEWDEGLGLPLCVVCQNAEKMDYLEKTQGWNEEKFDLVLQYLRTVLLKHGASLIYTSPAIPSPLRSLIHASLGIHSLLKREPLKHNVIDRDKIVVPPNWDSWGKIRVLRDGFEVENVSNGWSIDIDQPFPRQPNGGASGQTNGENGSEDAITNGRQSEGAVDNEDEEGSAVVLYESQVEDSSRNALQLAGRDKAANDEGWEVDPVDTQAFLTSQLERLDAQKQIDEQGGKDPSGQVTNPSVDHVVTDRIGPVQFNMGGIQVDADDMVQRLKDRQAYNSTPPSDHSDEEVKDLDEPTLKADDTQKLATFFDSLMKRKGTGVNSPKPANSSSSGV